jgi:ABC-type antimicrobial peptide transport system permease subunit
MVMKESLVLVSIGVAIGLGASLWAGRFVQAVLYGLSPNDSLTIGAAVLLILAVSALAGYLPARRASKVAPMVALHQQ